MRISKLILQVVGMIVGIVVTPSLSGQGSNTQFQDIPATGFVIGAAPQIFPISARNDVGQSNHSLTVDLFNNGGNTCNPSFTNLQISFEGSPDNVNWIRVFLIQNTSVPAINPQLGLNFKKGGVGAFPFLRVNLLSYDNTDCLLVMHYTGTLFPEAIPNNPSVGTLATFNYVTTDDPSIGIAFPMVLVGGVTGVTPIPARILAYGIQFRDSTIAAAAATTFTIGTTLNSSACAASPVTFNQVWIKIIVPAGTALNSFILPNSAIPYFTSNILGFGINQVCIDANNAATNHNVSISLVYRFE